MEGGLWEYLSVDGLVYKRGAGCDTGAGEGKDDVSPVTSENIEGVRAIGSHVAGSFAILAISFSTGARRLFTGATAVVLQQVAGENVMTRPLADLTHLPLSYEGGGVFSSRG